MNTGEYIFICNQNATFSKQITWLDTDGETPINLTGYSADLQVRPFAGSSTLICEMSTGNAGIVLGGALGTIDLFLSASATTALTPGVYYYDLKLTSGAGVVTRLLEGVFEITAGVTV